MPFYNCKVLLLNKRKTICRCE